MGKIGEINIGLKLDKRDFNREVSRVPAEANAVGTKISNAFNKIGKTVAAAFSVKAVVSFTKATVKSAAEVQAANSQFEQTFGNLSDSATAAMDKVAKESGIVKSRLQGVGTSIYAFAKTTGMESADALKMMQEALQVTADSAAYYDRSLEDTAESLKAFLKGNYANDAALGLSCTETTRNTAANKLYGKSFKDLSESQKQLTLLQMVKDANAASGALGQAARESDGLENVMGNLKESWRQFTAVIGKPILSAAVIVIQKITAGLTALTNAARTAANALGNAFGWKTAEDTTSAVQGTSDAIATATDNQEELTDEVKSTNEEAKRGVASFDKLNVISGSSSGSDDSSDASSGGSNASAVNALTAQANTAADGITKKFQNAFKDFYEKSGFKNFVDKVQAGINKVNWSAIGNNCKSIFNSLKPIAKAAFDQTQKVGQAAFGALGSAVGAFVQITGKSFQTITGGVDKWLKRDKGKIIGYINTIGNNFTRRFNGLGRAFENIGNIVGDSIDRMRLRMEESIANLLSGFTDFYGGIGTIISGAFAIASESLADWLEKDAETIGLFFDNLQTIGADVMDFFCQVFGDIGSTLSGWWNGDGEGIFRQICDAITNVGTTFMNLWDQRVMPVWNYIKGVVTDAWNNWLSPVFQKLIKYIGKVGELIAVCWNNYLSPVVNWIIQYVGPMISSSLNAIGAVFSTVFSTIGGVIGGIIDMFSGLIDFITGVFTGNWEKAWSGIKNSFQGIWNAIWSILKGVVNLIIDGINLLWTGIYNVVRGIVDAIGGVAGAIGKLFGQNWEFKMPSEPPLIPKLAKGDIVTAPTLALIGDNAGAGNGDPEVVSPLSKLQNMMNAGNQYDATLLQSILDYLKRLYEQFVTYTKNGGNTYQFVATLNGKTLFEEFVEQVRLYKTRYGSLPW
nr:hypothetical protein [uncultured Ruminococcus sp.]